MARSATNSKEFTIANFPKCDELRRAQYRRSHADNRCLGMWMETASCETEPVLITVKWKGTRQYLETVPRCFLSCEAEIARDAHLRVASSLSTATTRRWLSCTRTRRTLWKLTGRAGRIQADAGRRSIHRSRRGRRGAGGVHCRLRTNVKQLDKAIVCNRKLFKEMDYAKTNDQQ